ncbi:MAG: IS3 family transposase [Granulosicoccus sp.]
MRRKRRLHKPGFKATVALTAIRGEMTMAEMVKKFDVQAPQITQWKKQLLATAEAAFEKGDVLADEHEQEILELRAKVGQLVLENDFLERGACTDTRAQRKETVSNKELLPISNQCQLLGLARSTYYYAPKPISEAELALMKLIDQCYLDLPFYGTRRVKDWLLDKHGLVVNRKRRQRLRRLMGIETLYPKRNLSLANQQHRVYPYLLKGLDINRPNQVWATDITFVPMAKGFVYLIAIMDWYSRKVLSWRVSTTMDTSFCIEALEEAVERYGCPEIFNTDQGSQFTSEEFTQVLKSNDIKISMDGKGRWVDNVFVERLWRSVKYEEVYLKTYDTVTEAKRSLSNYFTFYNTERRHQSLGKQTPDTLYNQPATRMAA